MERKKEIETEIDRDIERTIMERDTHNYRETKRG